MSFSIKVVAFILAFFFVLVFFSLIRNKSVKPFYSFLWFVISILMFSVLIFEGYVKALSTHLGLTDATFLINMCIIFFLLIYVLYLSIKVSEMSDRIQELISFTALLEGRLRKNKRDE
jgi:hypothetical protein